MMLTLLLPALAAACPQCDSHSQGSSSAFFWVLGGMILLPFPTVGVVIYLLRRNNEEEEE
jgi:hypothetical protein